MLCKSHDLYLIFCFALLKKGMEESIAISSKQRIALRLKKVMKNKREFNAIENLLRKHTKSQDDISLFIQFQLNESGLSWSGPVCVASLGRFFLKFRKSSEYPENHLSNENNFSHYAVVHVVEEGSSIVLHFHRSPDTNLPYRIENRLHDAPITYYQKVPFHHLLFSNVSPWQHGHAYVSLYDFPSGFISTGSFRSWS